jgi:hypothetical protein
MRLSLTSLAYKRCAVAIEIVEAPRAKASPTVEIPIRRLRHARCRDAPRSLLQIGVYFLLSLLICEAHRWAHFT